MDFSTAIASIVSIHFVGNKGTGQECVLSKNPVPLTDVNKIILGKEFLTRFNTEMEHYAFHHPVSLDYNEVYNYCLLAFAGDATLHKSSIDIAKHLYESSTHPKIKDGELYVCLFENCEANGRTLSAIGIFKTETKGHFMNLQRNGDEFALAVEEGIDATKLDKGCLIWPTNAETGFDVLLFDNNRGEEAVFWKETFLNLKPQANEYYQTNQFLSLAKNFIAKEIPGVMEIEKTEQIDLLNKSVEYFRSNNQFDKKGFEETVLQDGDIINAFRTYETRYAEENDITYAEQFDISTQAVKKQARVFKSVLKLDKNFHVYIHGDKQLIEKGYDELTGKHFYKLYFDEES